VFDIYFLGLICMLVIPESEASLIPSVAVVSIGTVGDEIELSHAEHSWAVSGARIVEISVGTARDETKLSPAERS